MIGGVENYSEKPASIWRDNPMIVHLLGISPLIAVTDSATKALGLGVGLLLVATLSALTLQRLHQFIESSWQQYSILWIGLTLASYTTVFVLILQLYFFPLFRELGIYSYLITCNFALLIKMGPYTQHAKWTYVLTDSLKLGISLLLALVGFGILRELLFSASVFNGWEMLLPGTPGGTELLLENRESVFRFAVLQPAGFILLGLSIAILRRTRSLNASPPPHRSDEPVERARVTGRLKESKES